MCTAKQRHNEDTQRPPRFDVLREWASYVAACQLLPEGINHEINLATQNYLTDPDKVEPMGSSVCQTCDSIKGS